jgi:hypothetical protein
MSEALTVYAVPTARLLAAPGSRARAILARIRRGYRLAGEVDRMIEESNALAEEGGDEDRIEITFLEAVRRVIHGKPLVGADDSFVYGFAYDAICWALGRELPSAFPPFDPEDLDGALARQGVPLRVSELCFAGPAFPLPEPGEFPSIGRWSGEQLAAARAPVLRVPLAELDSTVAMCLRQIQEWYQLLEDGDCVVGILY